VKAWHFVGDNLRDGRPIPPDGETLIHDGPLAMCRCGLHGSPRLLDALRYAPGHTLCRTEHGGEIIHDADKLVSASRVILWRLDAEDLLRDFARRCALDVIDLWPAPEIVIKYLTGGDETFRAAAWDAASTAARDAWDAAGTAAWAARAAAWDAAWDAASIAASTAASTAARAARDAAMVPAWDKQNRRLTSMVMAATRRDA
jgi:hypothetical protein